MAGGGDLPYAEAGSYRKGRNWDVVLEEGTESEEAESLQKGQLQEAQRRLSPNPVRVAAQNQDVPMRDCCLCEGGGCILGNSGKFAFDPP